MQLHPTEQFTISRQLADPDDTDTNYVQATVRNAKTDELLKRVNLTLKGSQRFTGLYEVPADVSGQGFWITITTLVYSDSGYTVRNMNYNAEQNTYLVQDRANKGSGGGHGDDIDYRKLAKVIDDAVKNNKQQPQSLDPVLNMLAGIGEALVRLESKEVKMEKTNLDPVFNAISSLERAIVALGGKFTKVELTPLENAISNLTEAIRIAFDNQDAFLSDIQETLKGPVSALSREVGRLKKPKEAPVQPKIIKKQVTAEDLLAPIESPFFKNPKP